MALTIRSPRRAPARPLPPPQVTHGLRASAQRFDLKNKKAVQKQTVPTRAWQETAWEVFDDVPELKFISWYAGNVMSKLRLFVGVLDPNDPEADPIPVTDPDSGFPVDLGRRAQLELDRLKAPLGGRAEILRALNMNLEIAAECHLIGRGPRFIDVIDPVTNQKIGEELKDEEWNIYSVSQVTQHEGKFVVKTGLDGRDKFTLDDDLDAIVRFFQRHPRWTIEADCNMRGLLGTCEQLLLLDNSIKANAKSHMSAGWLLLPNQLSTGPDVETWPEEGEEAPVDQTVQDIFDGLVEPIEEPAAASAVAPVVIRGEAEALKEFRHVTPNRTADERVLDKIEACVQRIARGVNFPVEIVLGSMNTTFANAFQINRDVFDDYFEPRCVLVCDALTVGFLRPNLEEAGFAPELAQQLVVWFDPKAMIKKVNPVDSADQGITLGVLSGEAWRREKGWTEDDAPTPADTPTSEPKVTERAAITDAPAPGDTGGKASNENAPAQPIKASAAKGRADLGRQMMVLDRELRAKLIVAADRSLTRALEKAGNKLRAKAGQTRALAKSGFVHSVYVAATLGRTLVASSGMTDDELIGPESWDGLDMHFRTWVASVQARALDLLGKAVNLTAGERDALEAKQAVDRTAAWDWLRDQLHLLATERLYSPDPAVTVGEFDPTSRVPAGLIRQAIARAGGATGLSAHIVIDPSLRATRLRNPQYPGGEAIGTNVYVAVNNGEPPGGIATGELIMGALDAGGAQVDAYEWVYGPAYRLHEFDPHQVLDGVPFLDFDSDVLSTGNNESDVDSSWIGEFLFPGDHAGCVCDFAPTVVPADDLES